MLMLLSFPQKSFFGANGQFRVFEIALRDRGIPPVGAMRDFVGGIFFWGGGGGGCQNLMRSDFDHLNFFQSQKQHSVHIEHQLQ